MPGGVAGLLVTGFQQGLAGFGGGLIALFGGKGEHAVDDPGEDGADGGVEGGEGDEVGHARMRSRQKAGVGR